MSAPGQSEARRAEIIDRAAQRKLPGQRERIDCYACGGDGWLPSLPEGQSECRFCGGTGKQWV